MKHTISVQPTPNPNALKFILDVPVKTKDSAAYRLGKDCGSNKLAAAILKVENVSEVYFATNFITVTQTGAGDWDAIEKDVKAAISKNIESHDPNFEVAVAQKSPADLKGELAKIDAILNSTIRPALQRDGGDLQVLSLSGNTLTISYEGACGCCPHAAMGTLYAIQNILQDQYNPDIVVEMA